MDIPTKSSHAEDSNPIKSDPQLQLLVKKLDRVKKYNTFQRWKSSFLDRFEDFLYDKGMDPAEKSCSELDANLKKLVAKTTKVLDLIHKGDLGEEKKTVKASLALNEMCNSLESSRVEIELLVPSLKSEEKKKGYSKFHLGAALIRQNFHQYLSMKAIEDALGEIGETLKNVADRQQLDLFLYFKTQVQRFCDVMADLNLYIIMQKCLEFMNPPDEDESEEPEYLQIYVEDSSRKRISLEVEATDDVSTLKEGIAEGLDIPVKRQILKFKGEELKDSNQTMEALGVDDDDVFFVEPSKIKIGVKAPNGETVELEVDPDMRVSNLKRLLEEKIGLPARNQNLQRGEMSLNDPNATLEDMGIEDGAVLGLDPLYVTVEVQMPSEDTTFHLELGLGEESPSIKEKIEEKAAMPVAKQVLTFNGTELPTHGVSVKEMGLVDGSTIIVEPYTINIDVNLPGGETLQIAVDPDIYVSDLKRLLEEESKIPAKNQHLQHEQNALNDPRAKLSDIGVEDGATLDLEPKFISVDVQMPSDEIFSLEIGWKDETPAIKDKIAAKTGMPVSRQVLKFNGKDLPQEGVTTQEMGLVDGSKIVVEPFTIDVDVKTHKGDTIRLSVEPSNDVLELKKLLEEQTGIPHDNQLLKRGDEPISEMGKTLEDLNIIDGTLLDLEPITIAVDIQMPNDEVTKLDIPFRDDAQAIKDKIAGKTGMPVKQQVLTLNGEELPKEGVSTQDMGIVDGTKLVVEPYLVDIEVKTPDGETHQLAVDPFMPLADLHKALEEKTGLSPSNQHLQKGDDILDNPSTTLEDLGIDNGTVLDLEPKTITVDVEMPSEEIVPLEIGFRDETPVIKEKIEAKTGMPVATQVVKLDGNELPKDGVSTKDMGIVDGTKLVVEPFKISFDINCPNEEKVQVSLEPSTSIEELHNLLEEKTGLPPNKQTLCFLDSVLENPNAKLEELGIEDGSTLDLEQKYITVEIQMPSNETFTLELSLKDTVMGIKDKIAKNTGMVARSQILNFEGNKLVEENATAQDVGLMDGSIIVVETLKIPIKVKTLDEQEMDLLVDPTRPLSELQQTLEEESGIPIDNQSIQLGDKDLDDAKNTLESYNVKPNCVLNLEPKSMTVNVEMPDGRIFSVNVALNDDAKKVKAMIEKETGMEVPRIALKVDDKDFEGTTKARDVGIREGSTIAVSVFRVPVNVNTWDDKTLEIMVDPLDPLLEVKKLLEGETGIKASNQILSLENVELHDDNKRAKAYGIEDGTILFLEPRCINVTVEMPDGSSHLFEVNAKATGDDLKSKIAAASGIVSPRQVLHFNKKEVLADATVKGMGIMDGSTLQCTLFKIPITIEPKDGTPFDVKIEPIETIGGLKSILEPLTDIAPRKQVLNFLENELSIDTRSVTEYYIKKGSVLQLELKDDPIVFVDVKYCTLFGVDRDDVIEKEILTPNQGNPLMFQEAETGSYGKEKLHKAMLESPNLGVKPQIVVGKMEIEDYDLEEAEKVSSVFKVKLKKTQKRRRGEELIYVDLKTGGFGLVDRKKAMEKNFITVVPNGKDDTIEQAEQSTRIYDKYVAGIRDIFGIKATR